MKVLHLWQDYSPNLFDRSHPLCLEHGVASQVLCQAFIDNGTQPLAATSFLRRRAPEEANSRSLLARVLRRARRPIDAARFARLVKARLAREKADVVHLHFGTTAAALAKQGALPSQPMVVSFYGADISQALERPAMLQAYGEVFDRASILHVLCEEARERLIGAGCPEHKIRIANLPLPLHEIPDIGVDATTRTRFLIPARFVEKKGHAVLLSAFRKLVYSGLPVELTCFGYGPVEWLERAVEDAGLHDHVRVIDNRQTGRFIDEYLRVLRAHDVVLAPSIRAADGDDEGGPALTLVFAQAAGKPVIVSDFPGAERSVTDGREGRMVPAGNVLALQEAMADLVGRVDVWRRYGQAGQERVRREFADDTYWRELLCWYRHCLGPRP